MKRVLSAVAMAVAFALASGTAQAQNLNISSWGGAYTASQQKAYHDPYMTANPGVKIVNHDLGSGGLAKLRAEVESGKVTLDLIDMTADAAITACDEGLAEQIDPDTWLAPAPDGTPASKDFFAGTLTIGGTNCFIPQIVYSTTFGYRTDAFKGRQPSTLTDVFDLKTFPGKRGVGKEAGRQPGMGAHRRRGSGQGRLQGPGHRRGRRPSVRQARHHQGPGDLVDQGSPTAAVAGGQGGRDRVGLQWPAVFRHRREETADRDVVGLPGLRSGRSGWCRKGARISPR